MSVRHASGNGRSCAHPRPDGRRAPPEPAPRSQLRCAPDWYADAASGLPNPPDRPTTVQAIYNPYPDVSRTAGTNPDGSPPAEAQDAQTPAVVPSSTPRATAWTASSKPNPAKSDVSAMSPNTRRSS